jgi:lipopolysaccharide biosynthesis glycosyltransferase
LNAERLAADGLLRRMQDRRGGIYDLPSNAPCSTDFAISRFLVPKLAQTGWALFVDSDVVFMDDVAQLFEQADANKAVMVVKHSQPETGDKKMDGQTQTHYARKNWSSVMLWNCWHPANQRLSL